MKYLDCDVTLEQRIGTPCGAYRGAQLPYYLITLERSGRKAIFVYWCWFGTLIETEEQAIQAITKMISFALRGRGPYSNPRETQAYEQYRNLIEKD